MTIRSVVIDAHVTPEQPEFSFLDHVTCVGLGNLLPSR